MPVADRKPKSVDPAVELVAVDRPASSSTAHVARRYFAERLKELMAGVVVRDLESGRVRKLTPLRLHRLLKEQAPNLAVSQSQVYRYCNGDTAPDVEVVYEIAVLFGVPPSHFVPDEFLPE
jgi:transcriptional regulator with XRE-family HTH domain